MLKRKWIELLFVEFIVSCLTLLVGGELAARTVRGLGMSSPGRWAQR